MSLLKEAGPSQQKLGDTLPAYLVLLTIFHISEPDFLLTISNKDQHSSVEALILDSTMTPSKDLCPPGLNLVC